MAAVRHRRRLTVLRVLAVLLPVLTAGSLAASWAMGGNWPLVAAGVGLVASVVLGVATFRLDRRLRADVAAVRSEQATEYSDMHARYCEEHRQFTNHMVGLLDVAGERLDSMRTHVTRLEVELNYARHPRPGASTPSNQFAQRAEGAEWNDLWPDLSDAPTVIDLVAWDDKNRELLPSDDAGAVSFDEPEERSA